MFDDVEKYVPKDFSETTKNDLFASLSRKRLEESEVWLFQLPPEIKRVSDLEAAEWELDKDINEGGEIGVLRFPDGRTYGVRTETCHDLTRTAIHTSNQDHPIFEKFMVIYRKKDPTDSLNTRTHPQL